MNPKPVKSLHGATWSAIWAGGKWLFVRSTAPPLPKCALKWIGSVKRRVRRMFPDEPRMPERTNRGMAQNFRGSAYEVDMANAFLHVAQAIGYVSERQVRAAYRIRRKYGIKPAMLLGMALGGRIVMRIRDIIMKSNILKTVRKPTRYFLNVARTCFDIMADVAVRTKAIAWYVDALLYPKLPNLNEIRNMIAQKLGISSFWVRLRASPLSAWTGTIHGESWAVWLADSYGRTRTWRMGIVRSYDMM